MASCCDATRQVVAQQAVARHSARGREAVMEMVFVMVYEEVVVYSEFIEEYCGNGDCKWRLRMEIVNEEDCECVGDCGMW